MAALVDEFRRRGDAVRPKRHGNRGETGKGYYPALEALGIDSHRRLSPLSEEVIAYTSTVCDDFRTGWQMASRFGCTMSWKAYWSRFTAMSREVYETKHDWLNDGQGPSLYQPKDYEGARVVIACDGGRTRIREDLPGAPRKSGYHGFHADWR